MPKMDLTLAQAVARRQREWAPFSSQELARIAIDLFRGLESLHGCDPPIVHGAVRPSSVFCVDTHAGIRCTIGGAGRAPTPAIGNGWVFAAPETLRDGRGSPASDVWAVGCLLHALATASSSETSQRLLRSQNGFGANAVRQAMGEQLTNIVAACVERDEQRRPSAGDAAGRIEHGSKFDATHESATIGVNSGNRRDDNASDTSDTSDYVMSDPCTCQMLTRSQFVMDSRDHPQGRDYDGQTYQRCACAECAAYILSTSNGRTGGDEPGERCSPSDGVRIHSGQKRTATPGPKTDTKRTKTQ